jgi:hypothetical protein
MSEPKRHHYLPQFYLENFSKEGKLWVFDRKLDNIRIQTPVNTAVVGDYYSFENEKGEKDTKIEHNLSVVEGYSKPILEKMLRYEKISDEEKKMIIFFLSLMRVRVPKFENEIKRIFRDNNQKLAKEIFTTEEKAQELIDYAISAGHTINGITPKFLLDFIQNGKLIFDIERPASLNLLYPTSVDLSRVIFNMDCHCLIPPSGSNFITTDNPFIINRPPEISFDDDNPLPEGSQLFIPIGPKGCLVFINKGHNSRYIQIRKKVVRNINQMLALGCERLLISGEELLLKSISSIIKSKAPNPRIEPT